MKFEVESDGGFTSVNAVPSDPEGFFIVKDPFCGDIRTKRIAVMGIKGRHIRALQRGDRSVMARYIASDPNEPSATHFTNCDPGIPDPLQPVGTSIYAGNAQEVPPPPEEDLFVRPEKRRRWWHFGRANREADLTSSEVWSFVDELLHPFKGGVEDLKPVSEAANPHEAVGLWWAHLVLSPVFDSGSGTVIRPELPPEVKAAYEAKIGGFAAALATLSADGDIDSIGVDYHPDKTLREAAALSGLPQGKATFSWKSMTQINDGVVMARAGRSAELEQIWPPDQD